MHEGMTGFGFGREGGVVEAADMNPAPLAFEPQGDSPAVEFYGDVRALRQGEDVRPLVRVRCLVDDGRAGEAWRRRARVNPDAIAQRS